MTLAFILCLAVLFIYWGLLTVKVMHGELPTEAQRVWYWRVSATTAFAGLMFVLTILIPGLLGVW